MDSNSNAREFTSSYPSGRRTIVPAHFHFHPLTGFSPNTLSDIISNHRGPQYLEFCTTSTSCSLPFLKPFSFLLVINIIFACLKATVILLACVLVCSNLLECNGSEYHCIYILFIQPQSLFSTIVYIYLWTDFNPFTITTVPVPSYFTIE